METLEIINNEMMSGDGPVPMDLGSFGTHHAKMTQSDLETSNDMSYDVGCAIAWKGYKEGKGAGKESPNGLEVWHRGKRADEWTSSSRTEERKEVRRTYGDRDKGST